MPWPTRLSSQRTIGRSHMTSQNGLHVSCLNGGTAALLHLVDMQMHEGKDPLMPVPWVSAC